MMLHTRLILFECLAVLVVAHEGKMVPFAFLDGVRDGGTADGETLVEDAGEGFEGFELADERLLVIFGDFGSEFE